MDIHIVALIVHCIRIDFELEKLFACPLPLARVFLLRPKFNPLLAIEKQKANAKEYFYEKNPPKFVPFPFHVIRGIGTGRHVQ